MSLEEFVARGGAAQRAVNQATAAPRFPELDAAEELLRKAIYDLSYGWPVNRSDAAQLRKIARIAAEISRTAKSIEQSVRERERLAR
jgi:hypothetical protein